MPMSRASSVVIFGSVRRVRSATTRLACASVSTEVSDSESDSTSGPIPSCEGTIVTRPADVLNRASLAGRPTLVPRAAAIGFCAFFGDTYASRRGMPVPVGSILRNAIHRAMSSESNSQDFSSNVTVTGDEHHLLGCLGGGMRRPQRSLGQRRRATGAVTTREPADVNAVRIRSVRPSRSSASPSSPSMTSGMAFIDLDLGILGLSVSPLGDAVQDFGRASPSERRRRRNIDAPSPGDEASPTLPSRPSARPTVIASAPAGRSRSSARRLALRPPTSART